MSLLPAYTTPDKLAAHLGMSPRRVREKVREIGACRENGNTLIMLPCDVDHFMEAIKCPSRSSNAAKSGITGAPLPDGDYAGLRERLTAKPPKGSKRRSKQKPGNVISMGRGQG